MKKNRNSFFEENIPPYPYANQMYPINPINEIEERLSKIERAINRLEHRINSIEEKNVSFTDNNNDNMYMI